MTHPRKSKIYFFFEKPATLRNRGQLKKFIENIFKSEGKRLQSINFIFCSDEYLRVINRNYLKHDHYTDIVTFQLSKGGKPIEGEIYISVDRIIENALLYGESRVREMHRVIIHGALHLCGYKDKLNKEKNVMREREHFYLKSYF
jgi:probable rRNA maturation factor